MVRVSRWVLKAQIRKASVPEGTRRRRKKATGERITGLWTAVSRVMWEESRSAQEAVLTGLSSGKTEKASYGAEFCAQDLIYTRQVPYHGATTPTWTSYSGDGVGLQLWVVRDFS